MHHPTRSRDHDKSAAVHYHLPPPSDEQQIVMDLSKRDATHIIVRACAGSGKTTTCLHIAKVNENKRILLLTYNAKLKLETRVRVENLGLTNMDVHTYHSFAVRCGAHDAHKDEGLLRYVNRPDAFQNTPCYDMIIMDEVQDMNPLYYRVAYLLARKKNRNNNDGSAHPSLIFLGDPAQSIYSFNRADARFLILAQQIFQVTGRWCNTALSTTYRLTHEMARFADTCCVGVPPIRAVRDGRRVEYMIMNSYKSHGILQKIRAYLGGSGGRGSKNKPDDIFILAPSIKSVRSPVRQLANMLTSKGIPIYVPTSDEERLDQDVMRKKIVFSTFHQVKGLERKFVIVYNFDDSYMTYYCQDKRGDAHCIPNPLYVAITRATERLVVVHDEKNKFLPCVRPEKIREMTDMTFPIGWQSEDVRDTSARKQENQLRDRAVTELVRHLPVDVVAECHGLLNIRLIRIPSSSHTPNQEDTILDIPVKTRQADLYENVSEITGTCIPCLFEWSITKKVSFVEHIANDTMQKLCHRNRGHRVLIGATAINKQSLYEKMTAISSAADADGGHDVMPLLLRYATRWCAQKSGYHFKESQIEDFNWVSLDDLRMVTRRLQRMFPTHVRPHLQFEYPLVLSREQDRVRIIGFADLVDLKNGVLCEMKAVQNVDTDHLLQLAIYLYMSRHITAMSPIRKAILVNLLDGKIWQIQPTDSDLEHIVTTILSYKNSFIENESDDAFISMCLRIRSEIDHKR